MPELTTRRASVRETVLLLRARLAAGLGWDEERIIITAAEPDDTPHHQADQDILLRLEGERPEASIDGGGRYVNLRTRNIAVWARSRLFLDTRDSDLARLTHTSLGHVALEDDIVDVLEGWLPVDDDGNATSTPVILGTFSRPEKDRKDDGWVRSRVDLSFQYLRDLTLPELVPT